MRKAITLLLSVLLACSLAACGKQETENISPESLAESPADTEGMKDGKMSNLDMEVYDTVFIGYPNWWYVAPTIINTFLESYDFSGKSIIPFATSGGSGMGKTNEGLEKSCPGAKLMEGKLLNGVSGTEMKTWAESML